MKKPLSNIFAIFSGRDRSEKTDPMQRKYCTCGALKPEVARQEGEQSLKTQARTPEQRE
jgi:hypothetical protein